MERRTVGLILVALFGGALYGYNVSISAALPFVQEAFGLVGPGSEFYSELLSASATLADATSMAIGGWFIDRYGRERAILVACCASVTGTVASAFARSVIGLTLTRLLVGMGNGLSILTVPLFLAEEAAEGSEGTLNVFTTTPSETGAGRAGSPPVESGHGGHRGALVAVYQLGCVLGFSLQYATALAFFEWRQILAAGSVPGLGWVPFRFVSFSPLLLFTLQIGRLSI